MNDARYAFPTAKQKNQRACEIGLLACTTLALVAASPGHLKAYKTTKLVTMEETIEAMRKAGSIAFQGPSRG